MSSSKSAGRKGGLTRREFIGGVAGAGGGLFLDGCSSSEAPTGANSQLPAPEDSGIDHIVVVMMENRSFDHFLGWVPGADGIQAGVTLKDVDGNSVQSFDLGTNYEGCTLNFVDPDHSYGGGRTEINGGKMDGFLLTQPAGGTFPVGYYTAASLPFYKGCADNWTICDRYFGAMLAPTNPNRIYMHAGQTDRSDDSIAVSTLDTIWDRMIEAGQSVGYYYEDVPYTAFWGSKYQSFSKKYDTFAADVAAGNLPALSYVDSVAGEGEEVGLARDDHPFCDIRNGQAFLNEIYNTLRQGPGWDRTLLIINYDEWGGFRDHVEPPFAPVTEQEFAATGNDGRLGCRVPCVLIGPRARRGHVEHTQFDPNSILNMLVWRFGLNTLGARVDSTNIAHALDFTSPLNTSAPAIDVPAGPFNNLCVPAGDGADIVSELGLPLPPLPNVPVPLEVPLPFQVTVPAIPGVDYPAPSASSGSSTQLAAESRRQHLQTLNELRQLARTHGFC